LTYIALENSNSDKVVLAQNWIDYLNGVSGDLNAHRVYYATVTLVESIVFLFLLWYLPSHASNIVRTREGGGGMMSVAHAAAGSTIAAGAKAAQTVGGIALSGSLQQSARYLAKQIQSKLVS